VPLLIIPVLVVLVVIVLIPVGIVQRYRAGTKRQRARGWLVTINIVGLSISAAIFLTAAALTNVWVPDALLYAAAGLAGGALLGLLGLAITKWEAGLDALHYTPNRLLVLTLTLVITARILYGFSRAWSSWRAGMSGESWFVEAGVAGAMAAGAVVIGYYLVYWLGVRRQLRRHDGRTLRRI
jgi:hypothetical protein